ncbi:DUF2163 domain-containing protein [Sphingorhabdus sp.]|uniref:DUF2163 domain-containing protein n=1 Tax=Sphingorhabdus sp. TaxID=1902408 RepID=UPI0037CAE996
MDAWMEGPLTSVAYGWRLERADGVTLGFTSHDVDVAHDGILLRASPGMQPTTVMQSAGLDKDGLDVSGALTSDDICADDLAAGRWNGAYLEIFLFDWTAPASGKRVLATGELGAVSFTDDAFEAELVGLQARLEKAVAPQTSPSCRARFCDAACGLNSARFRHLAEVASGDDNRISITAPLDVAEGYLAYGELRWLTGPNCGSTAKISGHESTHIYVYSAPFHVPKVGDLIELTQGCDKIMSTCAGRFDNGANFRGEPYLPGNDLLTRYPGGN